MALTINYRTQLYNHPNTPLENGNQLDPDQVNKWIGAHPNHLRESVKELTNHVEHISFSQFQEKFDVGINFFNQCISQAEISQDYLVMVEPGKSNMWMAELAIPKLDIPPTQVTSLGKKGSEYGDYLHEQEQADDAYFPNTVVFFDDGIYSGKQMSNFIKGVYDATETFNHKHTKQIPTPEVVVICPYATEFGEKTIYSVNQKNRERVRISPHEKIKTLSEVLSPTMVMDLEKTLWASDPRNLDGHFSNAYQQGTHSRGNIWLDHKIPNWLSFAFPLEAGVVTGMDGQPLNGTIAKNPDNEPLFIANENQAYQPIPKTIPPYKQKQ